jgi:hypothetical protein
LLQETSFTLNIGSEGFRCPEHISALKNPGSKRISAFYWVFCPFLGIWEICDRRVLLYVVVDYGINAITGVERQKGGRSCGKE